MKSEDTVEKERKPVAIKEKLIQVATRTFEVRWREKKNLQNENLKAGEK
jgi:hypothetical protein